MSLPPRALVPMAFVKDVEVSIKYYERLGFAVGDSFVPPDTTAPTWAWLESGRAQLMLARATEPVVPSQQAVLFYLYYDDVPATRTALSESGREPGPITYPFYAPRGEFRLVDPDGYVLMITHT